MKEYMIEADDDLDFQICDTSGEYINLITNLDMWSFSGNINFVIIVYDITDYDSFDHLKNWFDISYRMKKLKQYDDNNKDQLYYIIGNKREIDNEINREVNYSQT